MRSIKRIPIVLQALPLKKYIESFNILSPEDIDTLIAIIDIKTLKQFWEKNPDLRLTQVLVNLNYIPNIPGFWYYTEEREWLIDNHILEPRDILFWGTYYDKDMNRIEPQTNLIKDLELEHIQAILEGGFTTDILYLTTLKEELARKEAELFVDKIEKLQLCENCGFPEDSVTKREDNKLLCDDCMKDLDYLNS